MNPRDVIYRMPTWLAARLLQIGCQVRGRHEFGRHFTDMGAARPEDGERPWCKRCGMEEDQ